MNQDVFFKNFELLADLPNSVQKLRDLILQLAVMGKLVPQDPHDEPPTILSGIFNGEKEKIPFEIPLNWGVVPLEEIKIKAFTGLDIPKKSQSPDYEYFYFKMNNITKDGKCDLSDLTKINTSSENVANYQLNNGDFLFNTRNSYELVGKTCIFNNISNEKFVFNNNILKIEFISGVDSNFVNVWFVSPSGRDLLNNLKSSTTNVAAIYQGKLMTFPVLIPPFKEQKRIVSKVDELMSLCDKLEARHQKKQEIQNKLNCAALDRMLSAENQEEFEQYWQRICENFDLLYDNPENVEKLKQAILQLAVQGKLVEQNPEDEPASVLIEKIKEEKKRLVKAGKIKNSKSSLIIGQDEIDQNKVISYLPDGWEMIRLEELGEFCGGGTPSTNNPEYWGGDIAWVSPKDMKESRTKNSEMKIAEKALEETRLRLIPKNSILIVARSGILKRLLPVSINDIECTVNQDLKVIIPFYSEISGYIQLMLKGYESFILENLVKGGMTVQSLKYAEFEKSPFPLPPLNEQKRIVEKVEQFMGLCDELESKLKKSREDREKLMEAVVKGLLEGAATEKTELDKPIPLQVATIQLK